MAPHRCMPLVLVAIVGCASTRSLPSYHTLVTDRHASRSLERARQYNEEGVSFALRGDASRAEGAFREALRCDPACAAAHGNLGLILQEKGRFYEAAIEWTLAKRLAPAAIEPYVNLMRMYTQIGWTKEAQREGERALTLDPAHPDVLGQLALLSLRSGVGDARLDAWLETLAREDDGAWSAWAQRQRLARRPETRE